MRKRAAAPVVALVSVLALATLVTPGMLSCGRGTLSARDAAAAGDAAAADAAVAAVARIVDTIWREHIDAGKRKDIDAVLEIYADDIVYVFAEEPPVRGIDAVREMETQTLAGATVEDAVHTSMSVHVFGDVAYEIGTVVGPVRVGDAPARVVRYHFMAMWERVADDDWRIRHIVGQVLPDDALETIEP